MREDRDRDDEPRGMNPSHDVTSIQTRSQTRRIATVIANKTKVSPTKAASMEAKLAPAR